MLSQKLQDDLMSAYQKVYESKRGHAAGDSDVEKQASQLASDVKYKAKGKVKPGASDEEKKKIYMQILSASPAPNAVKAMAKSKILGEEVEVEEGTSYGVYKGDGISFPERLKKKAEEKKKKNKKKVTEGFKDIDKKKINKMYRRAGNLSRDSISADNEKEKYDKAKKSANIVKAINKSEELRTEAKVDKKTPEYKRATVRDKRYGNPYGSLELGGGIRKDRRADHEARRGVKKEEVEIVDERAELKHLNYGNAVVGQKKGKEQTVKSKKAIPTGGDGTAYMGEAKKAKKDYDGDGKVESGTQEFLGSRDKAIKKAIAKRRGRYNEGFSSWRIDLDFQEQVKK